MHMHMPPEHTQCNDNYTISPMRNVNMFPRCILTEWEESAIRTYCVCPSYKSILDRCGAHSPTDMLATSFLAKYYRSDVMRIGSTAGYNIWLPQSTNVQLSSRTLLFTARCTFHDTSVGVELCRCPRLTTSSYWHYWPHCQATVL